MKKRFTLTIIAVLLVVALFTFAACAPTSNEETSESPSATETPSEAPSESASEQPSSEPSGTVTEQPSETVTTPEAVTVSVTGEIQNIDTENSQIHVSGEEIEGMITEVIANISEDTAIIDALSGDALTLENLTVGQTVDVVISMAMTRSLPPQSSAFAVIANLPEDGLGIPTYIEVSEVSESDGGVRVLNQNGDIFVTIGQDIEITDMQGNKVDDLAQIKAGSRLFAWFDVAAMSFPAQAGATKAVIISF